MTTNLNVNPNDSKIQDLILKVEAQENDISDLQNEIIHLHRHIIALCRKNEKLDENIDMIFTKFDW